MKRKRFTSDELEQAKKISVARYLSKAGFEPVYVKSSYQMYHSPLRVDEHPSFKVDLRENLWIDYSGNTGGDIIKLHMLLKELNFVEAVKDLLKQDSFSFHRPSINPDQPESNLKVDKIRPLQNKALVDYLASRKIPFDLAKDYLKEAYYFVDQKHYFSLAFPNQSGGHELRNKYFKNVIAPKDISIIKGKQEGRVNVFEGFMDFLSACVFYGKAPQFDCIILNSLTLISKALELVSNYESAGLFLDHDDAGRKATVEFQNQNLEVKDFSFIYEGFVDFNDFLIGQETNLLGVGNKSVLKNADSNNIDSIEWYKYLKEEIQS